MQPRAALRLLLLVYVFCFESDAYFLDGVVEVKDASPDIAAADGVLRQRWRPVDADRVDDSRHAPAPVSPSACARWRDLEHRDAAVSIVPQDSSPVGPA